MNNILDYLEKTAALCSYHVAVDDGDICLTWTELLDLSKRIGTGLCKKTAAKKPVVILLEKSALTLAAMFGTVYAGCFYVMVDPTQPPERLKKIFHVLCPELIVTDKKSEDLLKQAEYFGDIYLLKEVMRENIDQEKLNNIRKNCCETDLLYGIFTSGSTGTPKGVMVSQKAVIDFITHFIDTFGLTENDRIGNQAPFDFDVSVKDIYTSVFTGAPLVLIPKELFSMPSLLIDYLCAKKVTTLIWAVSALTLVSSLKGLKYKVPENVKRVMFSGEVMPVKQLQIWQKALPDAEFVNLYGPTEITCNCTYYPIKKVFLDGEKLPIGKPFGGREVFLLDDHGKEIGAADEIGEICVAGESLAEGYYRNEAETKAKFVEPFDGQPYKRYYRTGDLGCYDIHGELNFCGRKDFQIKHMGHRIELEGIEHILNQLDGVEKCCCLMDQRKNQLVAFYMGEITEEEIRMEMKKQLPSYMIPQKIIKERMLPLNKNGKTDREYLKKKLEVTK